MAGITEKDIATNGVVADCRALCREIRKAREQSAGIIGVNIMVALTHFADLVKTAIAEKIDIIFAGAGLPMDLPGFLKKGDRTRLVPIVSSGTGRRLICKAGSSATVTCPTLLSWKAPRPAATWDSKPINWTIRLSAWKTW